MKIILGLAAIGMLGAAALVYMFLFSSGGERRLKDEAQDLAKLAEASGDILTVMRAATTTSLTEATLQPDLPSDIKISGEDGMPTPEWTAWQSANSKRFSLSNFGRFEAAVSEMKSGEVVLADPNDNPLRSARPFLRIQFTNMKITKTVLGSL
jgi:hypothetical protein